MSLGLGTRAARRDEVQRFQHHVRRTVPERLLVAVNDPPLTIDRQALGGDGRAGDIVAQALQPAPLMGPIQKSHVQVDVEVEG